MPKGFVIQDEFSALPISPQRKYGLRAIRDGRCVACGKSSVNRRHCEFHRKQRVLASDAQRKKNPLVAAAYSAVCSAIQCGRLVRQKCEVNGCPRMGEAHHSDYSKPLDVNWLCRIHHNLSHGRISDDERAKLIPNTTFTFTRAEYLKRLAARGRARRARIKAEKKATSAAPA